MIDHTSFDHLRRWWWRWWWVRGRRDEDFEFSGRRRRGRSEYCSIREERRNKQILTCTSKIVKRGGRRKKRTEDAIDMSSWLSNLDVVLFLLMLLYFSGCCCDETRWKMTFEQERSSRRREGRELTRRSEVEVAPSQMDTVKVPYSSDVTSTAIRMDWDMERSLDMVTNWIWSMIMSADL